MIHFGHESVGVSCADDFGIRGDCFPICLLPEQLLSALLLQVFYGIRSERQLMEQLDYNLLHRWFAGLAPDDPVWDTTTFTKNRDLHITIERMNKAGAITPLS
jgi:Transposase domain (DUF772)